MKTYKSSDLTHKRAEVFKAAREEGVIIEERRSNGEVIERYTLCRSVSKKDYAETWWAHD